MSVINKLFKVWHYILGFFIGLILFFFGKSRISMGISAIRLSDAYTSHFMNVGLLYLQIGVLLLIAFSIFITLSLKEK